MASAHYRKEDMKRALIIKTGRCETFNRGVSNLSISLGDVVRSTPVLHLLKDYEVHWRTSPAAAIPLLIHIPLIKKIHYSDNNLNLHWDIIVNLEWSLESCALASDLAGPETSLVGYALEDGKAKLTRACSERGWSERLFSLFGEKWNGEPYFISQIDVDIQTNLEQVFLNSRVGPKIPEKSWNGWNALKRKIEDMGLQTKSQRDCRLASYMLELKRASFIISTDSLGLHIALALNKPVLGLFGPTNGQEVSGLEHYIQRSRMDEISPEEVFEEFKSLWQRSL